MNMDFPIPGYTKRELFHRKRDLRMLKPVMGDPKDSLEKTVRKILDLDPGENYFVITADLAQSGRSTNWLKRNWPVVRYDGIDPAIARHAPATLTPTEMAAVQLSGSKRFRISGMAWQQRSDLMVTPIVKNLDGYLLLAYEAHKSPLGLLDGVKPYADTPLAKEQGARFTVDVSSRSPKKESYGIVLAGVPFRGSDWRLFSVSAKRDPEDNFFKNLGYDNGAEGQIDVPQLSGKRLRRVWMFPHAVAAQRKAAAYLSRVYGDETATVMTPFPEPTQGSIDLYKRLQFNTLIASSGLGRGRKDLDEVDCEILLATYGAKIAPAFGHDGDVTKRDWGWSYRHMGTAGAGNNSDIENK